MRLVEFHWIRGETEGEDDAMVSNTMPVFVNPDTVRSVRVRNEGTGTRIEFTNSAGLPVTESVDEVVAKLTAAV